MTDNKPPLDPHPLSDYVAWAGNRNRDPILEVLKQKFPDKLGKVLEFASGSGMHLNFFAPHFHHLNFQPTDKDSEIFNAMKELTRELGNENVVEPFQLDLTDSSTWSEHAANNAYDAIFCINIFQVAPISIADGMMQCASQLLKQNGFLLIYGPFQVDGSFTTSSNEEFHDTLSSAGVSEWGLKDVADLKQAAEKHDLQLAEIIDMPANNFSLIIKKNS